MVSGITLRIRSLNYGFAKDWLQLRSELVSLTINLFFAGEHCSDDFQGYMNGAAQSGADTATAVMAKVSGGAKAARLYYRRGFVRLA